MLRQAQAAHALLLHRPSDNLLLLSAFLELSALVDLEFGQATCSLLFGGCRGFAATTSAK